MDTLSSMESLIQRSASYGNYSINQLINYPLSPAVSMEVCQDQCPGGRCYFADHAPHDPICCHKECSGGCTGMTNADCFVSFTGLFLCLFVCIFDSLFVFAWT